MFWSLKPALRARQVAGKDLDDPAALYPALLPVAREAAADPATLLQFLAPVRPIPRGHAQRKRT